MKFLNTQNFHIKQEMMDWGYSGEAHSEEEKEKKTKEEEMKDEIEALKDKVKKLEEKEKQTKNSKEVEF